MNKFTTEEFIKLVEKNYPNIDFSKTKYINAHTKIRVFCKIHNIEFEVFPDNLRRKKQKGCKFCGKKNRIKSQSYNREYFISLNNKPLYELKNIDYKSYKDKINNIFCKKHNIYFSASSGQAFLKAKDICPECLKEKGKIITNEIYLDKLKEKRLDKIYDLSKVKYINARTEIKLICKICNMEFKHNPRTLLKGITKACPNCNYYIGEKIIEKILEENNIEFKKQFRFKNTDISRLSFDFYIPEKNILIEYQGIQHYKAILKWGGEERLKIQKERDQRKREFCNLHNFSLIEIKYNENILTKLKENNII